MLKVGLILKDDALPRTEYWQRFLGALTASPAYSEAAADLVIPHEDMALETNWPRYGDPASAYVRGKSHDLSDNGAFHQYYSRIVEYAKSRPDQRVLYISMHPFIRTPLMLRSLPNVVVADVSLAQFERDLNPNTISMPTLPITASRAAQPGARTVLASFQGINSHPVRQMLKQVANRSSIVANLVDRSRHVGRVDATRAKSDADYDRLLATSTFAFVPRGDALFSYRLAEVMSFGCIPIILSDGWVLPFDRTAPWSDIGLRVHVDAIQHIPMILSQIGSDEIARRQDMVRTAYRTWFGSLDAMVATALGEAERLGRTNSAAGS